MSRIVLSGLLLILLSSFILHMQNPVLSQESDFLTYENSKMGIKLQYPSDWKVKEPLLVGGEGYAAINTPISDIGGIYIRVEQSQGKTLEEIVAEEIRSSTKTLEESGPTTISNNPAFKATFLEAGPFRDTTIWTIIGTNLYHITYTGFGDEYSTYLSTAEKVFDTIEITSGSEMDIAIAVSNDPASPGNEQTVTIATFDSRIKQGIKEANIQGTVMYPSGLPVRFKGNTDDSGHFSYNWPIDKNTKPGTFVVNISASSEEYVFPVSKSTTFVVR